MKLINMLMKRDYIKLTGKKNRKIEKFYFMQFYN